MFDWTCRPTRSFAVLGLAIVAFGLVSGCGNRGAVQGTVTLDDQPIDGGRIFFVPDCDPAVRPQVHATIAQGKYSLPASKGPEFGHYRVEIVWHKKPGNQKPAEPGLITDDMKQIIPAVYNSKTTLFVDVGRGTNTFDFALTQRP